jgi:aspartokinase
MGFKSVLLDSRDFIITDEEPLSGDPQIEIITSKAKEYIEPLMDGETIPVAQGFIAKSTTGSATTLGRMPPHSLARAHRVH